MAVANVRPRHHSLSRGHIQYGTDDIGIRHCQKKRKQQPEPLTRKPSRSHNSIALRYVALRYKHTRHYTMTSAMILSQSPLDLVAIAAYEQEEQMAYEHEEEVAVSSMGLTSDQGETTPNGIDSQRLSVGEESVPSLQDEDQDESAAAADIDETMDEILADEDDDCADTGRHHQTFGGLSNLGNTCYMASALQMLASLDSFVTSIREEELPEEKDQKLRSAFLDLMQRLNHGETVHPQEFKAVIDERSPLFVGYRQQDSHEFITNLLDFLDEDYAVKKENESQSATTTAEDEAKEESDEMDVSLSSRKKAKTNDESVADDGHEMATSDDYEVPHSPLTSPSSFSQLDMSDIDHLLHGSSRCRQVSVASPVATPPRYKLVGGRMNTTGVVLTSYESAKVNVQDETAVSMPLENSKSPSSAPCVETETQRKTPIDSYFTTTCRVRLTCDSCKFTRCHKETFLHLSLEIAPDCGSVEDGLRRFFAPEKRELKCEKCFAETATQTMEITELPKALLLHFKRFIVDISPDYSAVSYRKNQSIVAFDDQLEIQEDSGGILTEFLAHDCLPPKCSSPSPSYALRSIVNHIGSSASCGHYTADANRRYSSGARHWTRFNDSYVSTISQFEAIDSSQRTAYMVMYELV